MSTRKYIKIQILKGTYVWLGLRVMFMFLLSLLYIFYNYIMLQFSSVAQSCLTLCHPMNRSMPGLPVHYQLQEFTQTHVH